MLNGKSIMLSRSIELARVHGRRKEFFKRRGSF